MDDQPRIARLLLRDRVLLIGGLVVVTIVTWLYTIDMAGEHSQHGAHGQHGNHAQHASHDMTGHQGHDMTGHQGHDMTGHQGHDMTGHEGHDMTGHEGHDMTGHEGHDMTGHEDHARVDSLVGPHTEHQMSAYSLIVMWIIMMIAMMLPSAGPVAMLHARFVRSKSQGEPAYLTGVFLIGYCAVWAGFSATAAIAQIYLERSELMSPVAMTLFSPLAGGITLILAGLFQFTPWKNSCLHQCRTPLGFLMTEWRDGAYGSFVMGIKNGLFCLGCCWAIMLLLFVGGVMSMLWMAGLTALMLIEKIAPYGGYVARVAGVAMVIGGVLMILS